MRFKTGKVLFAAFMLTTALSGTHVFADDTTAPTIDALSPAYEATAVPITASISFDIWDTESGVSADTLMVKVNDIDVTLSTGRTGDSTSYNVSYTPAATFNYGQTVTVDISVKDVSENTRTLIYTFTTETDNTAPSINALFPTMNATDIPTNSIIAFTLEDWQTGVSIDTLQVTVNANGTPRSCLISSSNTTLYSYRVTCDPQSDLNYGDLITVDIRIADVSGNMTDWSYGFAVHNDTTAPSITDPAPGDKAANIPVNSVIAFTISDTEAGVSIDTLLVTINVNDIPAAYTLSSANSSIRTYHVTCDPVTDFPLAAQVTVSILVRDIAGNEQNTVLTFSTHGDTAAPQFTDSTPAAGASDVPTDAMIAFTLSDTETGVSIDTLLLTLNVNGIPMLFSMTSSNTDIYSYRITCDPVTDFYYNDAVTADVHVTDVSGNILDEQLAFTVHADTTAPQLQNYYPMNGATEVPTGTVISFSISDTETGVSIDSLRVTVNAGGTSIPLNIEHSGTISQYQVTCDPSNDLLYGTPVTVSIEVLDIAGNTRQGTFSFTTHPDLIAPAIMDVSPASGSTSVPTHTVITFMVTDNEESGISISSLQVILTVNGAEQGIALGTESISSYWYTVTGDPTNDLPYNADVTVSILIKDVAGNSTSETCHFNTVEDMNAPTITELFPVPFSTDIPTDTGITFRLQDSESGVSLSTLRVTINANNVPVAYDRLYSGTLRDLAVTCAPQNSLYYGNTVTVDIEVQDIVGNATTSSYIFSVHQDTIMPDISAIIPTTGATDIPTHTAVIFTVTDTETGIDIASLQATMNANGIMKTYTTDRTGTSYNSTFTLAPISDLYYADIVTVDLFIRDVSGNSTTASTTFMVHTDVLPPIVLDRRPVPMSTDIPTNTAISFILQDSETGIAIDTLQVTINANGTAVPCSITSANTDIRNYMITCDPTNDLYYGDTVTVDLRVQDVSGNLTTDTFTFFVHKDTIAPAVSNEYPTPNIADVPTRTIISFSVSDAETGLNMSSLIVSVNNIDISSLLVSAGTLHQRTVSYAPSDFYYGESVTVDIYLQDVSGNATTGTYTFHIHTDILPPTIASIFPVPASTDLPTGTVMSFVLKDSETGVSISGLRVTVNANGSTVAYTIETASTDLHEYAVTVDPTNDLYYGDTVTVDISVTDISGNILSTGFTFFVHMDTTKPAITNIHPAPDSVDIPTSSMVTFSLADDETGISIDSLAVTVDAGGETVTCAISYANDSPFRYQVTCDPATDFNYGERVTAAVAVRDISGNISTTIFSFHINTPPVITPVDPTANDTIVPVRTDIIFDITDNASIVTASLCVSLNSEAAVIDGLSTDSGRWTISYRTITDGYRVSIDPAHPLPYGSTIPVDIYIRDELDEPTGYSYTFSTDIPPSIFPVTPVADGTDVPVETDIVCTVTDNVRIVTSSLYITINNTLVVTKGRSVDQTSYNVTLTAIADGYRVSIDPLLPFNYETTNTVHITVSDHQDHASTLSYSFRTKPALEIYIAVNGDNTYGDGTVNKPYQTIMKGLAIVTANGNIHLFPGTYPLAASGNITWPNKEGLHLSGYAAGGATSSNVILDGQGTTRAIYINHAVNAAIADLTVRNGAVSGIDGGGIYFGTAGHLDLMNVIVTANSARNGGGIYANGASVSANKVIFSGNTALVNGGATYQGSWTLSDSFLMNNSASNGGISRLGNWQVMNSVFRGNHADTAGIGYGGTWTVENCTFYGNYADTQGGLMYGATLFAVNSVFWQNKESGLEQNQFSSCTATINYCIVSNVNYRNGSTVSTLNLLYGDPLFISSTDLRLMPRSPAVNTGTSAVSSATDIRGLPHGIYLGLYDMGAYEYDDIYIHSLRPTPGATNIDFYTAVTFNISDYSGAADISAVTAELDGVTYTSAGAVTFSYTGSGTPPASFTISIKPTYNFTFDQLVCGTINATAVNGTSMQVTGSFRTISDTVAPTISPVYPYNGATAVPLESALVMELTDDYSGIVTSSLRVTVNGTLFVADGAAADAATCSVIWSIVTAGYRITIDPTGTFDAETTITIDVFVTDLNPNPATMTYVFSSGRANAHNTGFLPNRHYTSVQKAIEEALNGHQITVEPGTYHENLLWPGTQNVSLKAVTTNGQWTTIFDGSAAAPVIRCAAPVSWSIEGLMLRNGNSTANGGGGILITSPGNEANISDCVISGNAAVNGYGGGIFQTNGTTLNIRNSIIKNNTALQSGGLYATSNASTSIINCVFFRNSVSVLAGGGALYGGSAHTIINSIFWHNTASGIYDQIQSIGGTVAYSIVQNAEYSGQSWDTGTNLALDPRFSDTEHDSFTLQPLSAAIEAGTNNVCATDCTGRTRPQMTRTDIGPYEYDSIYLYELSPSVSATNIAISSPIIIRLMDVMNSVPSATLQVSVNGILYTASGTNTFSITGVAAPTTDLILTVTPTANWPSNTQIPVYIEAVNSSGNIVSLNYHFTTSLLYIRNENYTPVRYYQTIQAGLLDAAEGHTLILNDTTFTSPVTWDARISDNITLKSASGNATNCIVRANDLVISGRRANLSGICLETPLSIMNSTVNITDLIVSGNTGTGCSLENSIVTIDRAVFRNNTTGIAQTGGTLALDNTLLYQNTSIGLAQSSGTALLRHCTIYGNATGISSSGTLTGRNSIIWANTTGVSGTGTFSYSDIQGGAAGTGNISSDPLFINTTTGNMQVSRDSPTLERGTAESIPSSDLTGTQPRMSGRYPDMGIYERDQVRLPLNWDYYYTDTAGSTENITPTTTIIIRRVHTSNIIGSMTIVPTKLGIHIFRFDLSDIIITKDAGMLPYFDCAATAPLAVTINNASPAVTQTLTLRNALFTTRRPLMTIDLGYGPITITQYNGAERTSVPSSDYRNKVFAVTANSDAVTFAVARLMRIGTTVISTLNFSSSAVTSDSERSITISVSVRDTLGTTVEGAPVHFTRVTGSSTLTTTLSYTNASGNAFAVITLPAGNSSAVIRASADGVISATDCSVTGNALNYYAYNQNLSRGYLSLAAAFADADIADNHIITVGPGTHFENLTWPNKQNIVLKGTASAAQVILNGNGSNSVIQVLNAVSLNIQNITLENGTTSGQGGAIAAALSGITLAMNDCIISANQKSGIYFGGTGTFINVTFNNNISSGGGALSVLNTAKAVLDRCVFRTNQASNNGGGFLLSLGSSSTFNACIFENNAANQGGAGTCYAPARFTNCIFISNNAAAAGGALRNDAAGTTIVHATFYNNTAAAGPALQANGGGSISNTILWNNGGTNGLNGSYSVIYSALQSWTSGGTGNITGDPQFIDTTANDLHLSPTSAALDMGTAGTGISKDIENIQRPRGIAPDMGAYEAPTRAPVLNTSTMTLYNSIHEALASANSGDTLSLRPGIYTENLAWPTVNGITLKGDTFTTSINCVIDGNSSGRVITVPASTALTLHGLTVQNGNYAAAHGGGICLGTNASISCNTVIISGNIASGQNGGGIYGYTGSYLFAENCLFINNRATGTGGGGALSTAQSTIRNSSFSGNVASNYGGAIIYGIHDITNTRFLNNTAINGGALYQRNLTTDSATLDRCIIQNNTASNQGGGIRANNLTMINSIVRANTAYSGGAIYGGTNLIEHCFFTSNNANSGSAISNSTGTIKNSIIWNNTGTTILSSPGTIIYSIVQNGYTGEGNLSAAPGFVNEGLDNFHLLKTSPAIEAGTNNILMLSGTDADNSTRPVYRRPDIGPYEYRSIYIIDHLPTKNETNVSPTTAIRFRIVDDTATVAVSAVTVNFQGTSYTALTAPTFSYVNASGASSANIMITVTDSAAGLLKAKSYTVTIDVTDANGISYQDAFTFYTTAPQTAYVSPNGSDSSGDGSYLLPFATIQKALNTVSVYGTVVVQKGQYTENLTWPNKAGISLTGATENSWSAAVIRTSGTIVQASYAVTASIRNLTIEGGTTGLSVAAGMAVSLDRVCISGNSTYGVNNAGALDLCNTVMVQNSGTALYNTGALNMIFTTITSTNGTALANTGSGTMYVLNSILWGNTAQVSNNATLGITYSVIQGGFSGTGNRADDPRVTRYANGAIQFGSSAIDAGAASAIDHDIRGVTRPQFTAPDCGAYEYIGPVIYAYLPTIDAQEVPVTTTIILKVREPERGLDITSLRITVNGTLYTTASAGVSISGTAYDITITLNPSAALPPNTTIDPQITIADVSGNRMEEYWYRFRTIPPLSVVYVSASASAGGSGTIGDPLNKVQSGFTYFSDNNVTGGVIIVLPGTYTENLICPTKDLNLILRGSPSGNSTNIIIDGGNNGRVIRIGTASPGNDGVRLTIENLTLQNGMIAADGAGIYCANNTQLTLNNVIVSNNRATNGTTGGSGGGIYAYGTGITVNIIQSTFYGNRAHYHGGALFKYAGFSLITGTIFDSNTATGYSSSVGGAIRNQSGELSARRTLFRNNIANDAGGAIHNDDKLKIYECELYRNQSNNQHGGAVYLKSSTAIIVNSLLIENQTLGSTKCGGGIYKYDGTLYLVNSTVAGNRATEYGGGVYNYMGAITVRNNILWGNTATSGTTTNAQVYIYSGSTDVQYNDIQGGYSGITNLNIDPQFTSTMNLNYEPMLGNLTIESGTANGSYIPTTDILGRTRPQLGRFVTEDAAAQYDLGAYEKTGEDLYPPVLSLLVPSKNAVNVPNNASISFRVADTMSGISINTLRVYVDHVLAVPLVSANWSTAYVTYNPTTTFNFGSIIPVTINIADVSGNMLTVTYDLTIQQENIPPVFSAYTPTPGATDAALQPTISAMISDNESGISQNSLRCFVNGSLVTLNISGTTANTYISYIPTISYGYGTFVRVTMNAWDMAGNGSVATYSFTTYKDISGPSITGLIPTNGATGISPTAALQFVITDSETGISINTLHFILNGIDRTASLDISGTTTNYTVRLSTPNFGYFETETVTINIADSTGNATTYSYSFETRDDTHAPVLLPVRPLDSSTQASHNTTIVFRITDTESGITTESIRCTVNGVERTASCSISGTITAYLVTISSMEYGYLQTVHVTASASDKRNNSAEVTWSFTTGQDSESPVIFGQFPAPFSVGASQTGPISFSIADHGTGVSQDTVTISVSDLGTDVTGTLTITGTGPTYNASFAHTTAFGLMHDIQVTINASDLAGNTTTNVYFFSTGTDTDPPHILAVDPVAGSINVKARPVIQLRFYDNETRIIASSIRVTMNGTDVTSLLVLSGGPTTYDATYVPTRSFTYNSTVLVQAQCADYGSNTTNYTYSFTIEPDSYAPSAPILSTPSIPLAPATTNIGRFTVTGSSEALSTVRVFNNGILLNSAQADSTGNFSVALTIHSAGTSVLSAICVDTAGNISTTSNLFQISFENKALAYSYYDANTTTNITANILIPVGAVSFNADVSISALPLAASTNELTFLIEFDLTLRDADTGSAAAEASFPYAVIVTMDVDTPFNISLETLGIYYFNTTTGRWQNDGITLLSVSRNMIAFATTHFTTFSIAQVTAQAGGPDRWTLGTYVAPNPVDLTKENIHFIYHKKNSGEAAMFIQVYDLSGQKIWEGKDTVYGQDGEVAWNGEDMWGSQLANGVYIAYIVIQGDGERVTKRVKFAVLK